MLIQAARAAMPTLRASDTRIGAWPSPVAGALACTAGKMAVRWSAPTGPVRPHSPGKMGGIARSAPVRGPARLAVGHFATVRIRRPGSNPMAAIIGFAIFSTRRLEEITRIQWADLDTEASRILVRDMKNPGEKMGNDVWCDLPPEALRVIGTMPRRRDGAIFPFTGDAISASFTRACKLLAIPDLHFHDLRHDGVSRQFELGKTIPQVAAVSGHRSWQSLKRYTHLRQTGDKYEG